MLADFARSLKDAKKSSVFIEDMKEEGPFYIPLILIKIFQYILLLMRSFFLKFIRLVHLL